MEQDIEKENRRLRDLLYDKIMFIEHFKKDYRTLTKTLEEITDNYNKTRDLTVELKAENDRLKEEVKQLEDFVKSSGEIDHINHEYTYKLKQTLQEIKAIAKECTTCGDCNDCKYTEHCSTDIEAQALGVCRMILNLITKAEEE